MPAPRGRRAIWACSSSGRAKPPGLGPALAEAVRIDEAVSGASAPQTLADVAELARVSPTQQAEPLWRRAAAGSDAGVAAACPRAPPAGRNHRTLRPWIKRISSTAMAMISNM